MDLTGKELAFLRKQKYSASDIYDGRGLGRYEGGDQAEVAGKKFVLGDSCSLGHRLFSRSGKCIQCNSANIAFQERHSATGYIYIAASKKKALVKVGSASDIKDREKSLNNQTPSSDAYGGISDWRLLCYFKIKNAGRIEKIIHGELDYFCTPHPYKKNKKIQAGKEIFLCSFSTAYAALNKVCTSNEVELEGPPWISPDAASYASFADRKGKK